MSRLFSFIWPFFKFKRNTNPRTLGQYLHTLTLPSGATMNTNGGNASVENCN